MTNGAGYTLYVVHGDSASGLIGAELLGLSTAREVVAIRVRSTQEVKDAYRFLRGRSVYVVYMIGIPEEWVDSLWTPLHYDIQVFDNYRSVLVHTYEPIVLTTGNMHKQIGSLYAKLYRHLNTFYTRLITIKKSEIDEIRDRIGSEEKHSLKNRSRKVTGEHLLDALFKEG